jgi:hypothetical protein
MILRGTVFHSLYSLGLRARENNNLAAKSDSKLNSNMTESTNTHNRNTVGGANTELSQDSPDSGTSTHERSSMCRVITLGDRVDTVHIPDCTVAEGTIIEVVEAILFLVAAELVPT